MPFETNIFINCPFDTAYQILLRPLLFTVIYLDLEPKISQTSSSSVIRINQIKEFIKIPKYGIHDLSRCKPLKQDDLPRFNMPYELGLDIGCAEYGGKKLKQKKILILETDRYFYQKVISDIAGQDIQAHNNDPKTLVKNVRNWFSVMSANHIVSANTIWIAYNQFYDDLTERLTNNGHSHQDIEDMPTSDLIKFAKDWIASFKA